QGRLIARLWRNDAGVLQLFERGVRTRRVLDIAERTEDEVARRIAGPHAKDVDGILAAGIERHLPIGFERGVALESAARRAGPADLLAIGNAGRDAAQMPRHGFEDFLRRPQRHAAGQEYLSRLYHLLPLSFSRSGSRRRRGETACVPRHPP